MNVLGSALSTTLGVANPLVSIGTSLGASLLGDVLGKGKPTHGFMPPFGQQQGCGRRGQEDGGLVQVIDKLISMIERLMNLFEAKESAATPDAAACDPAPGGTTSAATPAAPPATQPGVTQPGVGQPGVGQTGACGCPTASLQTAASNEFLWKPSSEKDGKLAVLLPSSFNGKVKSVEIRDSKGKLISKSRYAGIGNGERGHYRFDKAGSKFPKNAKVVITLDNGTKRTVTISQPGERIAKTNLKP
jgi:hypothetical protein